MAAAEARNPRRNIPKVIKRVYFRVLLFYIGGALIIGLLVPSNNPLLNLDSDNTSASPFVIAFNDAGIKALPSVRYGPERLVSFSDNDTCRSSMLPF